MNDLKGLIETAVSSEDNRIKSETYLVKAAIAQCIVIELLLEQGYSPEDIEKIYNERKNNLIDHKLDVLKTCMENIRNGLG